MSQRYGPTSDSRYPRERSPPRPGASNVHPSRSGLVDSRPKDGLPAPLDAPRGPRASSESFRPYGHARGRGIGRGDFRSDFRDRDNFRRDASPPGARRDYRGGRVSSPTLDRYPLDSHRDSHDQPRDFEFGRGRGRYRDLGPGRFGESRGGQSYYPGRDDTSWGRAQFLHPRGRGRGFHEDRGAFRGHSRSPPARSRWERSLSPQGRRPLPDRFEDNRFDRRGSEKLYEKDDRPRDDDDDKHRGDRYQTGPASATSQSYRPASSQPSGANRMAHDGERDTHPSRRMSNASDGTGGRERVYDSFRPEPTSKREATTADQLSSRPSSPPRAPQVPAFGSLPTKTAVSESAPWNKWIAPEQKQSQQLSQGAANPPPLQRSPPPANDANVDECPPPPPPHARSKVNEENPSRLKQDDSPNRNAAPTSVSPKLEPQQIAPRAPKAQRRDPSPFSHETSDSRSQVKQESPKVTSRTVTQSIEPTANAPTAPASKSASSARDASSPALRSPPRRPRQLAGVPAGPKASLSPLTARTALSSPGFNPPSGPRAGPILSPTLPPSVPTGPRAERAPSVNTRPPFAPGGPASWQWNRVDSQPTNSRSAMIPAKRDFSGGKRDFAIRTSQEQDHNIVTSQADILAANQGRGVAADDSEPSKRQKLEHQAALREPEQKPEDTRAAESASEEETMDIDDDSAKREQTFQQNKARLESKMLDLSARHLRGCSPLREMNLLARLSLEDLSTFFDAPPPRSRKPTTQRAVSQPSLKSPNATDEQDSVPEPKELRPSSQPILRVSRVPKPQPKLSPSPVGSPELRSLPFLQAGPPTPFSDREELQENLKRHEVLEQTLRNELRQRLETAEDEDADLCEEYEHHYRVWRQHVRDLDAEQKEREDIECQDPSEQAAPTSVTETSPPLQTPSEGRRRGLHATDYELEKVLEMSKLEAEREAQEKRERDAANAKPNWELEAVVPNLLPAQDVIVTQFADTSCLRDPKQMVMAWDLVPPEDDFTQEEHDTMLQNFKDFPKKFGKIAGGLPDRSYKDCINHYYATKWDGKYKPPRDKRRKPKAPSVRRRDARPRANALISNLNEDAKPDLYDGDDAAAPLNAYTESGRPKRAAAPTFKDKDLSGEQSSVSTPVKKPGKGEQSSERTTEKPGRKPRASNKEPRQRKPRIQAAPRRDSISPERVETDPDGPDQLQPSARDFEGANALAALGNVPQPLIAQRPTNAPAFMVGPSHSRTAVGPEAGKIQTVRSGHHATGTSSYWSVQEVEMFPQLISKYGTDWTSIASEMGTKTHTMVKNYFGRLCNKGSEIRQVADAANKRREEGGERVAGPLSTPNVSNKRIKESGASSQPRPLTSTGTAEVIDLDEEEQTTPSSGPGGPPRTSMEDAIVPSFSQPETIFGRTHQGPSGNSSQPFSSAPFPHGPQSYAPVNQSALEPHTYAPREPIVTAPTPAPSQYAPISRPMEFGPVSNAPPVQPSMGRPSYQTVRPGIEDVVYRPPLRPVQAIPAADGPSIHGQAPIGPNPASRPAPTERSLSDDVHRAHQHTRRPSPQPPSVMRHLIEQPSSRPQSTTYLEHIRSSGPPPAREEASMSSRNAPEKLPPPPVTSKPEGPRRSNLMSILNDEPSDPLPRPPPSKPVPPPPSNNQTPPQYGAAPTSSYPPPRPSSRIDRRDTYPPPREHVRNPSIPPYQPYLPPTHQHMRTHTTDGRATDGDKLHPNTFRIQWPPTEEARPPPEPAQMVDYRSSLRHVDSHYNPSPPPAYGPREANPGSGHNSPFTQRVPPQYLTNRIDPSHMDPSPPPARSYTYAPPPTHSRDASIQHLNPERRAPPPSVLQPQHNPQARMQPPAIGREPPPFTREYISYPPPERERPLYGNRDAHAQNASLDAAFDERRIWPTHKDLGREPREHVPEPRRSSMHDMLRESARESMRRDEERSLLRREEERQEDRRVADWTQGLRGESRFAPAPQYAPYQPVERRDPDRGH